MVMSQEEQTVWIIKGAISELPPELREACEELADHFRRQIEVAGSPVGPMAIALVGAELQAKHLS
jgi:hypothetical protein